MWNLVEADGEGRRGQYSPAGWKGQGIERLVCLGRGEARWREGKEKVGGDASKWR